jgi:hypothetical protein
MCSGAELKISDTMSKYLRVSISWDVKLLLRNEILACHTHPKPLLCFSWLAFLKCPIVVALAIDLL